MPTTTTASHAHTANQQTSLTISHTSDANPLYVLLSWYVPQSLSSGFETAQIVTGVTFNGTALTLGEQLAVDGQTFQWWRLATPAVGTANVVITASAARLITAAAVNLSGWPASLSDHILAGASRDGAGTLTINASSRAGGEVLDWIGYNAPLNTTAPTAGQTQLWDQDGTSTVHSGDNDQLSSGSIKAASGSTTTMSWSFSQNGEIVGMVALSFTVTDEPPVPGCSGGGALLSEVPTARVASRRPRHLTTARSFVLEGLACRWNVWSRQANELGQPIADPTPGVRRVCHGPECFTDSLTRRDPVILCIDYDAARTLASTENGTLAVWADEEGLRFRAHVDASPAMKDFVQRAQIGMIRRTASASFRFKPGHPQPVPGELRFDATSGCRLRTIALMDRLVAHDAGTRWTAREA